MEDIYNEDRGLSPYADGFIAGAIIGKHFGSSDEGDGTTADNTAGWEKMGRRSRHGIIASIVRINTALFIVASIAALLYVGFTSGFNF